ncbi:DUF6301 family protein [Dactylosporangium sp. CA-092794]|uniref:DUF6301 family protein n=1 Tax=Dactylosporangium sp. CA-092794 TaxID=3239929 RepID=UPI003D8CC11E
MSMDLRVLAADEVRALARRLLDEGPLLYAVSPAHILADLGWKPLESSATTVLLADPGLGLGRGRAALNLTDDGTVRSIATPICDVLPRPITPEGREFVQDAFALGGRALAEEFGPAEDTEPGDEPSLAWRRGESTLALSRGRNVVSLHLWRASDYEDAA